VAANPIRNEYGGVEAVTEVRSQIKRSHQAGMVVLQKWIDEGCPRQVQIPYVPRTASVLRTGTVP
jgi:hypothetical protein